MSVLSNKDIMLAGRVGSGTSPQDPSIPITTPAAISKLHDIQKTQFTNVKNEITNAYSVDEQKYKASYNKAKDFDGVSEPIPLTETTAKYNLLIEEIKTILTNELKSWAAEFKSKAEEYAKKNDRVNMDMFVARINEITPYANKLQSFVDELTSHYSIFIDKYKAQMTAYQNAKNKVEAEALMKEAEKARALAEELDKKEETLKAQNNLVGAQVVANQSAQLNKIADAKEAQADAKAPKSKLGIVLALAAAGAAIMAAQ